MFKTMSDSDNISKLKWLTTPQTAGMLKLKHHQDGLNAWDVPIGQHTIWNIIPRDLELNLLLPESLKNLDLSNKQPLK